VRPLGRGKRSGVPRPAAVDPLTGVGTRTPLTAVAALTRVGALTTAATTADLEPHAATISGYAGCMRGVGGNGDEWPGHGTTVALAVHAKPGIPHLVHYMTGAFPVEDSRR
jgi:hypothetical protein